MSSIDSLLDLPDLVLHNICCHISDPFDLLYFGNTCTRLRRIASAPSLWWPMAFWWCEGIWIHLKTNPDENHPRDWLLGILRELSVVQRGTEPRCDFATGERWERAESRRFRCLFGMLRLAYERNKDDHPAVLYEQWLYDIGLYRRVNVRTDFACQDLDLTGDLITRLTHLGQAVERDLRRRKQPNKDPKYYLKRIAVATKEDWMTELFPAGPHGTICPLLMCPLQNAVTNEVSGLQGLSVCLSMTLAKCLRRKYLLPLKDVLVVIRAFCSFFIQDVTRMMPEMEARFGTISLRTVVLNLVNENAFDKYLLQSVFNLYGIKMLSKNVLIEFSNFLHEHDGIDTIVDSMRARIRRAMYDEINGVLFCQSGTTGDRAVARLNLTDSDLIGGDNSRQEMSSAAFISGNGVLVSWHLTGRMRF